MNFIKKLKKNKIYVLVIINKKYHFTAFILNFYEVKTKDLQDSLELKFLLLPSPFAFAKAKVMVRELYSSLRILQFLLLPSLMVRELYSSL